MRCERAEELFSDYCEGQVPPALMVPFESHLKSCPGCARGVAELKAAWMILDAEPRIEAPDGFRARVWQGIDAAREDRPIPWLHQIARSIKSLSRPQQLAWGATAVVLFVFGSFAIPGRYNPAGLMGMGKSPAPQFLASQPVVTSNAGSSFLDIPLILAYPDGKVRSESSVPMRVRVLGGPVKLAGSDRVTLSGTGPASVRLLIVGSITEDPAILEVTRLDGKDPASQQLTIPLPRQ